MINIKPLENAAENLNAALTKLNLAPGDTIWVIRNICDECPEKNNQCRTNCKEKDKNYLEKTSILRAGITIGDGMLPVYKFTDAENESFSITDIGVTVFRNKEEAVKKL